MNKSSIGAITYTVEVGPARRARGPTTRGCCRAWAARARAATSRPTTPPSSCAALQRIFNDILATNSVFASASLPLSADNSGLSANQVYMGVFRPDAAAARAGPAT